MELGKDTIVNFLKSQGRHEDAAKAADQLPDKVDHEKHKDLLSRLGIDPGELLDKLPGGLGGKLGGFLAGKNEVRALESSGVAAAIDLTFLRDGGQPASDTAQRLLAFLGAATTSLDLAVYDAHFDDDTGDRLLAALDAAESRGVRVRAVYNDGHRRPVPVPPPPEGPSLFQRLAQAVPAEAIPGVPDLMHHKYVVRDRSTVWTGSTNWTADAWTRMENVIVTVSSGDLATAYTGDFEQLWDKREVANTGKLDDEPATLPGGASVRALFSPGRGRKMSQLVATRIAQARRRIRICSPVLTSSPILATLAEVLDDGACDAAITVDGPQMAQALDQWRADGRAAWKGPLYERVVASGKLAAKPSTPYAPGAVHDYMHAKLVVCDDWVLTGSYNCSHSGEMNAENLLEIHDPELADRCASFCDDVHARYADARGSETSRPRSDAAVDP